MTKLSPAAQAVRCAYQEICEDYIETWLNFNHNRGLAAALRVAVNEVAPEKTIEDIDYVHQSYVEGYKDALYEILIIANELEAS